MDAGVLELTIISKKLGGREIISNLSLCIQAGEVIALTGPSGRGKSTVLHIAAGLDADFCGQRSIGADVRLGMVFQEPRLLPWRSASDNLSLCHPPGGKAAITAALADVGLGDAGALFPRQMSLGMQRRVAIARALVMAPTLLIADEPLASLDAQSADSARALLSAQAKQRGCAMIIATHNPQDLTLADRIMCLN